MKKTSYLLPFVVLAFLGVGCGARLPAVQTSQKIVAKHFKKYGKKYKETDFGRYKVEKVEISGSEEIEKNLASVEGYVYLSAGGPVYRVRFTLRKKTLGWRYIQWENLGVR